MNKNKIGWIFSSPYIIFAILFFFIPLVWAFYLSSTDWNLISSDYNFVGIDNYIDAIKSKEVQSAFVNTFKYGLIIIPFTLLFSFGYAYILFKLPIRLKAFFTISFFLPYLTSGVATSILVRGLFTYDSPLSMFLRDNFDISIDLRQDANIAIIVMSIMIIWKMSSYYFLFFLSSLESIPKDIFEAAKIDGSTGLSKLMRVTIPNLYPAIFTVVSLSIGLSYSIFTEPYMITGGGPDFATTTWQLTVYNQSFVNFDSGYGAAIAILNAILVFMNIYIVQKLLRKWGNHYGHE